MNSKKVFNQEVVTRVSLSDTNAIRKVFAEKTVLSSRQLLEHFPNRVAISRAVRSGLLQKVGAGYYSLGCTPLKKAQWIALSLTPQVVISGVSSLEVHGLLPLEEGGLVADIPPGFSIRNSLAKFRQEADINSFDVVVVSIEGGLVRTYGKERALAEIYLNRFSETKKNQVFAAFVVGDFVWDKVRLVSEYFDIPLFSELNSFCAQKVSVAVPPREPSSMDLSQRVIQACIMLLGRNGTAAVNFNSVSLESGVSVEAIQSIFSSVTVMQEAVYLALTEMLNSRFKCIQEGFETKEDIVDFFKGLIESGRSDYMGYKIQKWAMAEESEIGRRIASYLAGAVIKGLADFIQRSNSGTSRLQAEARAYQILMISDSYLGLRWFYGNLIKTESSPSYLADAYEKFVLNEVIPHALKIN